MQHVIDHFVRTVFIVAVEEEANTLIVTIVKSKILVPVEVTKITVTAATALSLQQSSKISYQKNSLIKHAVNVVFSEFVIDAAAAGHFVVTIVICSVVCATSVTMASGHTLTYANGAMKSNPLLH